MKLTFKDKFMELLDDEDVIKKLNKVLKQKNKILIISAIIKTVITIINIEIIDVL